jgi:hypothetical protein
MANATSGIQVVVATKQQDTRAQQHLQQAQLKQQQAQLKQQRHYRRMGLKQTSPYQLPRVHDTDNRYKLNYLDPFSYLDVQGDPPAFLSFVFGSGRKKVRSSFV